MERNADLAIMSNDTPKPNGMAALLTTLASSGDKMIQFGILVLVGLSGLGNWLATNNNANETRTQVNEAREQAFRNIKDLHDALDDFENRQKAVLDGLQVSLRNEGQLLDNQGRILSEIRQTRKPD
jgi:hypothetical protein